MVARIKKNAPLTNQHYKVLEAVKELQPCGSTSVAKLAKMPIGKVHGMLQYTLFRRGLVDHDKLTQVDEFTSAIVHTNIRATTRLTPLGEKVLADWLQSQGK